MAMATAERRCAEVGVGKPASREEPVLTALVVLFDEPMGVLGGLGEEKKEVGRAMRTTPRREVREAYCAERGKGSCRKR